METTERWQAAMQAMRDRDSFAAIELLCGEADAVKAMGKFDQLMRHLYEKKDLAGAIAVGRAGIQHGLMRAASAASAEAAEKLKGMAKAMAYNLGAFTWPGFDEPGITITSADLAVGYDAARTNLRLGTELKRPAKAMGNAHWLVGAHALSAGEHEKAERAFEAAASLFEGEDRAMALMARGYVALTHVLSKKAGAGGELKEQVDALRRLGGEDGSFFADQILTAQKVLEGK